MTQFFRYALLVAAGIAFTLSSAASEPGDQGVTSITIIGSPTAPLAATLPATDNATACTIKRIEDLQNIGNDSTSLSGTYCLAKDIDASKTATWNGGAGFVPIGTAASPFVGSFDGKGYIITNLTIKSLADNIGLFGYSTGAILNVGLVNVSVSGRYSVSVAVSVGGLVGSHYIGNISNSYTTGAVTTPEGSNAWVGGLIGSNEGNVTNSYSTVSVNAGQGPQCGGLAGRNYVNGSIKSSYATGPVRCSAAGGLVGQNYYGSIIQSYSTGSVSVQSGAGGAGVGGLVGANAYYGLIKQSFATGSVSGGTNSNSGGLVGDSYKGNIVQSYATGSVSGSSNIAGGLVGVEQLDFIQQSYSSGSVSGGANSYLGSLLGSTYGGQINYSYASGSVSGGSGSSYFGGLVGFEFAPPVVINSSKITTAQLKARLHTGFDTKMWSINASISYPYFDPIKITKSDPTFSMNFWAPPLASLGVRGDVFSANVGFKYFYPIGQRQPFQYTSYLKSVANSACKGAVYSMVGRAVGDIYPTMTITDPQNTGKRITLKGSTIDAFLGPLDTDTEKSATWPKGPQNSDFAQKVYVYSPAIGAKRITYLGSENSTPIGYPDTDPGSDIVNRLKTTGNAVLICGVVKKQLKTPLNYLCSDKNDAMDKTHEEHWMLGTSFIKDDTGKATGIVAHDPWTGAQVIIDIINPVPAKRYRVTYPSNFGLPSFQAKSYFYLSIK